MPDSNDQRKFTRVHIQVEVETEEGCVQRMHGETNDLSLGGFFVETADEMEVGYEGRMEILLDGGLDVVPIEIQGKVVRACDDGYGIEIVKVYGVDSFSHLRNLVIYNAPDVQKVQSEFEFYAGLKPIDTHGQITVID
ncbi:MAG: PilZ domain-containing protein [Calditrichaeota bacterium]|nr:MAG: PilZ domain-containing protein [Calditrichota bacterium]